MSKISILLIGTLLFVPSIQAQSQSDTVQTNKNSLKIELDRIVVTASKLPLTQRETTKPVIIIDRRELDHNAGRDISQILNSQSGIRVNDSYGSPANSRILYLQGAAAQNTLILLDGKPVTDPSGVGGLFDLRLLNTHQLERIEVIKGSQSTLYGTDAIAGVINLISATPADRPISGNGTISYGAFNTFSGSAGVSGSLNNRLRYQFSYTRNSSDGLSAAEDPDGTGEFGSDGYSMNAFFGKADLKLSESFIITPFLNVSSNDGDYDGGAFQDADNSYKLSMYNPGIRTEFRSGDLRVRGDYGFTRTEREFISGFGENRFEGQFHDADLYADYSFGNYAQLLAGFNYQDYSIPVEQEGISDRESWIASPYTTFYLKNLNGFNAELGYRLNRHSEYGTNSTFSIAPSYYITGDLKIFASATTGFKVPTPDELFGPFGANPDLDPQQSLYLNTGLEAFFLERSLKAGIQYYSRRVDDLIIFTFDQGYVNRNRQNDRGVELTANWLIGRSVTAGAWYNYTDGEITEQGPDGEITRSNLIRRPEHSLGLNTTVQLTDQLLVRLEGEWNGERTDLYFNPANNFSQEDVTLEAYTLVNLYAEYALTDLNLTMFGDVKNLFNTDFTEVYGFNTIGIALKAGIRFRL